jgi:hypothetical protein
MKRILQETLLGTGRGRYSIVECLPGKALYLLDLHIINMQFKLKILDSADNQTIAAPRPRDFSGPIRMQNIPGFDADAYCYKNGRSTRNQAICQNGCDR